MRSNYSWEGAQIIIRQIREAFRGVRLDGGVGLKEGQVIDEYGTDEERAAARGKDEKEDWGRIEVSALTTCQSSLYFFDSEGMRFHLPAFLLADIDSKLSMDLAFHLGGAPSHPDKFELLNQAQREAVGAFIDYMIEMRESAYMTEEMAAARHSTWARGDV